MKSLSIIFAAGGATLTTAKMVEGTDATIQAAMVNIATPSGSDPTHPDRGTSLLKTAVSGLLINDQEAMHAVNFAAVDTLFFIRANEPVDLTQDKLEQITTRPLIVEQQTLKVDLQFVFQSGLIVGILEQLTTNG